MKQLQWGLFTDNFCKKALSQIVDWVLNMLPISYIIYIYILYIYIYIYIYIGLGITFYTGCFFSANQELLDKINAIQLIKFKVTEIIY